MFITELISVYLIIGLVWTAYTANATGNFFEGENLADKLGRVGAFLISVVAWPFTLLVPWIEGYLEAKNERNQN